MKTKMKREIKFRAWDAVDNEMLSNDDIKFNEMSPIIQMKYYVFLQYTGLKGMNGVEIYKEDICEVEVVVGESEYLNPQNVYTRTISYKNIEISFIDGCFVLDSDYIPDDKKMLWLWESVEIVGNIYENMELLK